MTTETQNQTTIQPTENLPLTNEAAVTQTTETEPKTLLTTTPSANTEIPAEQVPVKTAEEIAQAEADLKAAKEAEEAAAAPIEYEFEAPEDVPLNQDAISQFKDVLTQHKIPQETANQLLAIAVDMKRKEAEDYKQIVGQWEKDTRADKEIGGDNFPQAITNAVYVIDKYTSPTFQSLINSYGLGNHPEFVRAFAKIGAALRPDDEAPGDAANNAAPKSAADILFNNDGAKQK